MSGGAGVYRALGLFFRSGAEMGRRGSGRAALYRFARPRVGVSVVADSYLEETLMALNIRNPEAERLAAELVRITGETETEAVATALRDRLARVRRDRSRVGLADRLVEIGEQCAALPVLDDRTPEEILGHDDLDRRNSR